MRIVFPSPAESRVPFCPSDQENNSIRAGSDQQPPLALFEGTTNCPRGSRCALTSRLKAHRHFPPNPRNHRRQPLLGAAAEMFPRLRCFLSSPGRGAAFWDGWAPERADVTALPCHPSIHTEQSHRGRSQRHPGAASKCRMSRCLPGLRLRARCCSLESFCQPDVQQEGGTGKCRQLLAPSMALLRLGNLLSVFESQQPKLRRNGAGFHPRLPLLDRCLLHSPGCVPVDGLRLADAAGEVACACSAVPGGHFLQPS